MDYGVKQRATS